MICLIVLTVSMIVIAKIIVFDSSSNESNIEISNDSEDKKINSTQQLLRTEINSDENKVVSQEESERIAAEAKREFERNKPGDIIYITKEGKVLNAKEGREFYKKYRIVQEK